MAQTNKGSCGLPASRTRLYNRLCVREIQRRTLGVQLVEAVRACSRQGRVEFLQRPLEGTAPLTEKSWLR